MSSRKSLSDALPNEPGITLDEDERKLFERELAGVRPLPGPARVASAPRRDRPVSAGHARKGAASLDLSAQWQGGRVSGAVIGISHATLASLARGERAFEATCDLHSLSAELALHRVERFITESAHAGRRAVLVICGRGLHSGRAGPVLKKVLVDALCKPPLRARVLAFTSAPPARGGEGALAILLRRSTRPA